MPKKMQLVQAVAGYVRSHPEELVRAARNALSLRVGVPLQALRWFVSQGAPTNGKGSKGPRDVEIEARPPGVYLAASFELMGTPIRASGVVYIERVITAPGELKLELRLAEVSLKVLDDKVDTPVAALLKSGALDLSKPGNLAAYMPKRPPILVEARDDRIVVDLMRHPKLLNDPKVRKLLELLTPLVIVSNVSTDSEHVDLSFRAFPEGLSDAVQRIYASI
jgi:hypothetical protein